VSHKKWSQLIFVCNFAKNQGILMHFTIRFNDERYMVGMNFTHLTSLMLLHDLVKVETPKMQVYTNSAFNVNYEMAV